MTTTTDHGVILTPTEAAAMLRISLRTLRAHTSAGDVPVIRIGRSVRYRMTDITASTCKD